MALDVALAKPVELFFELERLNMLGNVSDEKTHCFLLCAIAFIID